MKTLGEWNRQRSANHAQKPDPGTPAPNGIACPECGLELYDSWPCVTLMSNPPKKDVHCQCGFKSYRVV